MKASQVLRIAGAVLLAATALQAAQAQAVSSDEKARIKASNFFGFASEEIHVVARDLDAGEMDNAGKSYRQAKKYYNKAFKQLDKVNLTDEEIEAIEKFRSRAEKLDLQTESLTSTKVRDLVSLVDEVRDYFRVSG